MAYEQNKNIDGNNLHSKLFTTISIMMKNRKTTNCTYSREEIKGMIVVQNVI